MRNLARLGGAFAGAVVVLSLSAGTATAHNELIGSIPEDGSTVDAAPEVVELAFDQPVQREFDQVVVLDEDDDHHEQGEAEIVGGRVRQPVGDLEPGTYRISYRVVSADGHPVSGEVTFTVSGNAATPTPSTDSSAGSGHSGHEGGGSAVTSADDEGVDPLLLTAGGVAAVGILGALVFFAMGGRRRPDDEGETAR